MACSPREGKLACLGKESLGCLPGQGGRFITDVPVRKGRKKACLSGKEGRQRTCHERKEDIVPIKKGRKKGSVPAREWRLGMACLSREGKLACLGKESVGCLPGQLGRFHH